MDEHQIASEAVAHLRASFDAGKNKTRAARLRHLESMRDVIVKGRARLEQALMEDLHKSNQEAYYTEMNLVEHEIQHMVDELDHYMSPTAVGTDLLNIGGYSRTYPDPLGVVCIIGAWNYPVQLTLMPAVGALAAGNTVLIKVPSDRYSSATSRACAELVREMMDQDIVRVVEGGREMTAAVLEQRYDKIFFTGGCFVGKLVAKAAAEHLTPTVLELGGKSPAIVTKSADLSIAARRICWGAFLNCGQTCVRPDYVLVDEAVASRFFDECRKAVTAMYGEDAQKSGFFGRVINERAVKRLQGVLDRTEPGTIKWGGRTDAADRFVEPTLIDYGTDEATFEASASMEDEIFGPLLPALRYGSLDQAIRYINRKEKPLSLYVFTSNSADRDNVLINTTAGSTNVNDVLMHMSNSELPFGGVGKSGMGRYHGKFSFDCFTHNKAVLFKPNFGDVWARYPPYDSYKVAFLNLVQAVRPKWLMNILKLLAFLVVLGYLRGQSWPAAIAHFLVRLVLGQ
eukprot:g4444.t1